MRVEHHVPVGTIVLKFTGFVNCKVDNELNLACDRVSSGGIKFSASCAPCCELVTNYNQ